MILCYSLSVRSLSSSAPLAGSARHVRDQFPKRVVIVKDKVDFEISHHSLDLFCKKEVRKREENEETKPTYFELV
jgi:hypothetical protein